jgi:hypothetical protein
MEFAIINKTIVPSMRYRKAISFSGLVRNLSKDQMLVAKDNDMYELVKKRNTALATYSKKRNKDNTRIRTTIEDKVLYVWKNNNANKATSTLGTLSFDIVIKNKR